MKRNKLKDSSANEPKKVWTKKNILKEILNTSLYFLIVLVLTFFVIKYVGQRTQVLGRSMEPTMSDGDNLLVDKVTYKLRDPKRGEVIVFPYRDRVGIYYIKRVIGLPGETIYIDEEGNVYIDGECLKETYIKEKTSEAGIASTPITLGEDEYFVMGDNRNNSTDSRSASIGIVHRDEIIGKAFMKIWPITHIEFIKHG